MAGSTMLFACTKCHSRHKFDDLSKEEQLCKECRRKYPLVCCNYCQLEFHVLKKAEGAPVCSKCSHNLQTYGEPKSCRYCAVKAAFKDKYCSRCISSEKKYGPPTKCQGCNLVCAFKRPQESQAKVNGQILCLKCTFKFKKERHQQQKQYKHDQRKSKSTFRDEVDFGSTGKDKNTVVAPLKAENIHKSLYKSRIESAEPSSRHSNRPASPFSSDKHDNNNTTLEPTFGDHMTELTSLREQIIKLNKIIVQKEKTILEKDKKISELQAEQWEKDKLLKSKVQSVQKEYEERCEQLQLENQSLRKQIKDLTKMKKTPKLEKVSSRIRLEAHKISLTPTSNRSPAHTPSKSSPEHITVENTANTVNGVPFENYGEESNVDFQQESTKELRDEDNGTVGSDTADEKEEAVNDERDVGNEIQEDRNEKSGNESDHKEEYTRQKSFDEAQAGEIKRLLQEDGEASSETDGQSSTRRGKKRKHKKRKNKPIIEDDEKDDYPSSSGFDEPRLADAGPPSRKRKVRKSKAFVDDDDDDEEDDKNIATASTQEENHSGEEGNVNKAQKQPSDEEMADDNLQVDERPQSPVEESDDDEKRNTGPSSDSDLD